MVPFKDALERWVEVILPSREEFIKEASRRRLTIYHGVDPTGPDLHLGHSTNYLLMRALQDAGHKIILLIGNFTAKIGDPSDKTSTRRRLSDKEIVTNLKTYKDQVSKILRFKGENIAEIKFNNDWLSNLTFSNLIALASEFTVQQMIERDIFQRRLKEQRPLYLHEFLYPLAQGYDSVAMKVDAEIGGTDQTFNMLVGRSLVKNLLGKEKFVISTPLLVNPKTGKKLMSKSEGSYVGLNDEPNGMFGKIMAFPDEVIDSCFRLCTRLDLSKINLNRNPIELKKRLAWEIVKMYHSETKSDQARDFFEKTFQEKAPEFRQAVDFKKDLISTIAPLVKSKSEAKRLIIQGAVDVNGETVTVPNLKVKVGDKIKVGQRIFVEIRDA